MTLYITFCPSAETIWKNVVGVKLALPYRKLCLPKLFNECRFSILQFKEYMNTNEASEVLYRNANWDQYKSNTLKDTIRTLPRASRQQT